MNILVGYSGSPPQPQRRYVCRFHQRGICRFGNRCRNIHIDVEQPRAGYKANVSDQSNKVAGQEGTSTAQSSKLLVESNKGGENLRRSPGGTSTSTSTNNSDAASCNKSCGICLDTIRKKENKREQTFGILPNCDHCFCFTCLRKWRQSKEFDFNVSKACPVCRKPSDYVYPSKVWFELKEQKESFISREKTRMQTIDCRYFNKGKGSCPFGNTCLYLHALPNGTKMDVGPPKPRKRRVLNFGDAEILNQFLYWLNDDDLDIDEDDDETGGSTSDIDLDELLRMQNFEPNDMRRYFAIQRQFLIDNDTDSDNDDVSSFTWFS